MVEALWAEAQLLFRWPPRELQPFNSEQGQQGVAEEFFGVLFGVSVPGSRTKQANMAERTGLEPATPGVTGRYSNQLNYRSAATKLTTQL